ncbi:bifunctional protein-disulfide isomerase/oxidoreductase DsbC [Pseudomonas neustonica]|uniref:bifunctional protein-disulfide isomerase/oxidoreductase DsbC n=1 Tax=Pseudomonas neustonica TaxID=2487346 RepID=UPI003C8E44F6
MRLRYGVTCLLALWGSHVMADTQTAIIEGLAKLKFDVPVSAISETPVDGLYQVQLETGRVLYATADGKYFMQGTLIDVNDGQPRNLTSVAEASGIAQVLDRVDASDMVVFAPEEPKTHVTVFTDVDCGYCRKLHSEVEQLNNLGIEVRYMAFPRGGMQSPAAQVMQSVWCADNRQQAMTSAKQGKTVEEKTCANPVAQEYELGKQLGVQGTPAIFLANGVMIPGYQPAQQLATIALENKE